METRRGIHYRCCRWIPGATAVTGVLGMTERGVLETMTIERALRALAGFLVVASVALGYWVHPGFFLFTAFVGLNLFQSAFTNSCPAMAIFRKLGLRPCVAATDAASRS
jgi:hypothetical protein